MNKTETFFRLGNIKFFLNLENCATVKDAAKRAGISTQHSARIIKCWRDCGLVVRESTLHGRKYRYSKDGLRVKLIAMHVVDEFKE